MCVIKLLYSTTKDKIVESAKGLIKSFEIMQKEAQEEACRKGYCPNKQFFKPNCEWKNINKEDNKVLLKYTLEVFEKN